MMKDHALGRTPTLGWELIAFGGDAPGSRSRHGLVFDKEANIAVLFGGIRWHRVSLLSDTWELHGEEWRQIRLSKSPPARHRGAMIYLECNGRTLLFGGQGRRNNMLGDTWLYADRKWRLHSKNRGPSPRCGHSLAYDEKAGVAVLFGGIDPRDRSLGDTWIFNGDSWEKCPVAGPSRRRYAAFAYDPGLGGCLLHGGSLDDRGTISYGDAWLFKNGSWSPMAGSFETSPRDDHGLAYHRIAKKLVMLEGVSGERGVSVRDATDWQYVEANPIHPRHQCSPLTWNDDLGGLLLHGGEVGHGGPQFDQTLLLRMPSLA
jgi:hypothetical protein